MATKSTNHPNAEAPQTVEARVEQGQLVLVVDRATPAWKLDDRTKEIGRRGLAQARAALRPAAAHLAEAA